MRGVASGGVSMLKNARVAHVFLAKDSNQQHESHLNILTARVIIPSVLPWTCFLF